MRLSCRISYMVYLIEYHMVNFLATTRASFFFFNFVSLFVQLYRKIRTNNILKWGNSLPHKRVMDFVQPDFYIEIPKAEQLGVKTAELAGVQWVVRMRKVKKRFNIARSIYLLQFQVIHPPFSGYIYFYLLSFQIGCMMEDLKPTKRGWRKKIILWRCPFKEVIKLSPNCLLRSLQPVLRNKLPRYTQDVLFVVWHDMEAFIQFSPPNPTWLSETPAKATPLF